MYKINLKTKNLTISSLSDKILQCCERKVKVGNQTDHKNEPIILRYIVP